MEERRAKAAPGPAESEEGYMAENASSFQSHPARDTPGQLSLRILPPEPLRPHTIAMMPIATSLRLGWWRTSLACRRP